MKNIHVLPTDKPSRLIKSQDNDFIFLNTDAPNWFEINFKTTKQNIYITSDEEIENCWFVNLTNNEIGYIKNNIGIQKNSKKIILTTDQDLIKDGVQAIDDEFLEWFVKNPSCEWVETERLEDGKYIDRFADGSVVEGIYENYKIILPKEEALYDYGWCKGNVIFPKEYPGEYDDTQAKQVSQLANNLKQETLEQVAKRILHKNEVADEDMILSCTFPNTIKSMVEMAEWQKEQFTIEEQHVGHTIDKLDKEYIKGFNEGSNYYIERMYSEEDMAESFMACWKANVPEGFECKLSFKEWFEQFKKK